jgi:hypothetical protein
MHEALHYRMQWQAFVAKTLEDQEEDGELTLRWALVRQIVRMGEWIELAQDCV